MDCQDEQCEDEIPWGILREKADGEGRAKYAEGLQAVMASGQWVLLCAMQVPGLRP
jgi:hypothetical protein